MRGKHQHLYRLIRALRITPADAGKTAILEFADCRTRDHPRGCGENRDDFIVKIYHLGSPPRMRGKRLTCLSCRASSGITPADAGKTRICIKKLRSARDHPRGCGENGAVQPHQPAGGGSPPRMRGKPFETSTASHSTRITPADAGKTLKF